eukprot:scaffold43037_cov28-Tisochrysis_lutea.AAC.4
MGTDWPKSASNLLLETARARSPGSAVRRSETNCSTIQRLTSQAATIKSTISPFGPSRLVVAASAARSFRRKARALDSSRATR